MNSFPSMMMNNGPLSNAVVIHRQLSCIDESATDEEQQDKILYYYPEDTPLYQQLSKVTMLEGLIEFSGKFSSEPIQSVVMDNTTWVFCNCEKDFWIILGISNKYCPPSGAIDELFIQTPSDMGLYEIVCRMYGLYTTFFPRINNSLANQNGWHIIQRVQSFRKAIRKQRLILKQQYQDKKCLEDRKEEEHEEDLSESLGIQRNKTTCEDLDRDIAGTKKAILDFTKQLENELMNYPVRLVRESLSRYLRWFLFSGECFNPSGFHGLIGAHYLSVGSHAMQALVRVQHSLDHLLPDQGCGRMILHDGYIIWSDLEESLSFSLYDFIRIQEMKKLRESLFQQLSASISSGRGNRLSSTKKSTKLSERFSKLSVRLTKSSNLRHIQRKIEESCKGLDMISLHEWLHRMKKRVGFICRNWEHQSLRGLKFDSLVDGVESIPCSLDEKITLESCREDDESSTSSYSSPKESENEEENCGREADEEPSVLENELENSNEDNTYGNYEKDGDSSCNTDMKSDDVTLDHLLSSFGLFCPTIYSRNKDFKNSSIFWEVEDDIENISMEFMEGIQNSQQPYDSMEENVISDLSRGEEDDGIEEASNFDLDLEYRKNCCPLAWSKELENCLGRALLYRYERLMVLYVVPQSSLESNRTSKDKENYLLQVASMLEGCVSNVLPALQRCLDGDSNGNHIPRSYSNGTVNNISTSTSSSNSGNNSGNNNGSGKGVGASSGKDDEDDTMSNNSGSSNGNRNEQSNLTTTTSTTSSLGSPSVSPRVKGSTASVSPHTHLYYFNTTNRGVKMLNFFSSNLSMKENLRDPLLQWPWSLLQAHSTCKVSSKLSSSDLSTMSTSSTGLDVSKNNEKDGEIWFDSSGLFHGLQSITQEIRPRYPLSPSWIAASIDPRILRAINDVQLALHPSYPWGSSWPFTSATHSPMPFQSYFTFSKDMNGNSNNVYFPPVRLPLSSMGASEVCLRVSTGPRGGLWVIGKKVEDRLVILVLEKCSTLFDVYELYTHTIDHAMSHLLI